MSQSDSSAMTTACSIGDLREHLQQWDPPQDVKDTLRVFASYEESTNYVKLQDQEVYQADRISLKDAVKPVLEKLGLDPV